MNLLLCSHMGSLRHWCSDIQPLWRMSGDYRRVQCVFETLFRSCSRVNGRVGLLVFVCETLTRPVADVLLYNFCRWLTENLYKIQYVCMWLQEKVMVLYFGSCMVFSGAGTHRRVLCAGSGWTSEGHNPSLASRSGFRSFGRWIRTLGRKFARRPRGTRTPARRSSPRTPPRVRTAYPSMGSVHWDLEADHPRDREKKLEV